LNIAGFSILGEEDGIPSALPLTSIAPQQLPAGTPSPWLAQFRTEIDPDNLSILSYGLAPESTDRICQVEILHDPGLMFDPQGNPYFAGIIQNQEGRACQVRLLLQVLLDEEIVNLVAVDSSIPLQADEQRPFGFRLESLPRADHLEDLVFSVHLETGLTPASSVVVLPLSLSSVENLGSNLFLQGEVSNTREETVHHPTVFAALRSTEGQLLTASWLDLPGPMEAGQTLEFVLPLAISEGVDIGSAEFDLRSLALPSVPSR
jgi:hypothetical protein